MLKLGFSEIRSNSKLVEYFESTFSEKFAFFRTQRDKKEKLFFENYSKLP